MFVSELHAMMKDYFSDDELLGILHYIDSHPVRELKKLKKLTLKKVDKEQPE
jgi:hypothetical protein